MASISLPPQHRSGFSQHFDSPPPSNPDHNRRLTMGSPLPNPPFVFPARDPEESHSQPEPKQRRTPAALPAFSFNPGAGSTLQPPIAPTPRPGGHRRRHSEFVGGDQLVTPGAGEPATKRDEPTTPTQPSAPSGPPPGRGPGRRHHAHRRSAAISGVDLIQISKALNTNPAASAPTTPGDHTFDDNASRLLSSSATSIGRPTPPASPQFPSVPPVPPIPAAIRIEPAPSTDYADTGRPDSAVSYELSPSAHLVKFDQAEPPVPVARETPPNSRSKPRPKTADASLAFDLFQTKDAPQVPSVKRSKSTGYSRSNKSRSMGNLDASLAKHASDDAHSTDASRPSYSEDGSEMSDTDNEAEAYPSTKKARSKSKKKQKRIRSWAGGILTRGKGKRHGKGDADEKHEKKHEKKAKPPALTPPTLTRTNSEVGSVLEVDFDNDDVVVLRTPTNTDAPVSAAERAKDESPMPVPSLETSWKPRSFYEQNVQVGDEVLSSPIIDLDAALGPFNTPGDNRQSRSTPSKFSLVTQRMYSGGRRGEFVGPEMRYHRRTESAPVMPPFDRSALSAVRLTGNSAMETPDVFYEEDEDAFLAANQSPRNELASSAPAESAMAIMSSCSGEDKKSVKSQDTGDTLTKAPEPTPSNPTGLGIQATEEPLTQKEVSAVIDDGAAVDIVQTTCNSSVGQPRTPVEILKPEESVSKVLGPPSPDISPRFLAIDKRPATSPQELLATIPPFSLSAGVSPSDSSFPSPDVPRFNDRNFSSHSYHHLPSDYSYASVEDVPSLTSSASTMTGTMHRFSATFLPRARLSTDRAASFSAAVNRRSSQANTSKRSSLASLSKLVGGPHSERSKLYQEEKPPGDATEKSKKKRRISRLMHFWKVKDKEKHTEPTVSSDRSIQE